MQVGEIYVLIKDGEYYKKGTHLKVIGCSEKWGCDFQNIENGEFINQLHLNLEDLISINEIRDDKLRELGIK